MLTLIEPYQKKRQKNEDFDDFFLSWEQRSKRTEEGKKVKYQQAC